MSHQDDVFLRLFIGVLVILTGFTIGALILANIISDIEQEPIAVVSSQGGAAQPTSAESGMKAAESGMKKAMDTGSSGGQTPQQTASAEPPDAGSGAAAGTPKEKEESVPGEKTYTTACFACHGTGAAGAPVLGKPEQWEERLAKGMDTLYDHAINGFKAMPPKGGRMDLSDDQVKAAVDYMVAKSQ